MNDLLKNVKWPDTGLDNRIHRLTRKAKQIEKQKEWREMTKIKYVNREKKKKEAAAKRKAKAEHARKLRDFARRA